MRRWTVAAVVLGMLVSGCATNVEVAYPEPGDHRRTGVILVRFTEPMTSVNVQVDGMLLVEDRHTERVEIRGVPAGRRELTVVASSSGRSRPVVHRERIRVEPGERAAVLLATPEHSTGYWIRSAADALVTGALLVVLWTWQSDG